MARDYCAMTEVLGLSLAQSNRLGLHVPSHRGIHCARLRLTLVICQRGFVSGLTGLCKQ